MDNLISRQAAIDAIRASASKYTGFMEMEMYTDADAVEAIKGVPSAQSKHLTDDDFETIRIHLNAYKENLCNQHRWKEAEEYQHIIDRFMAFASAQSELTEKVEDILTYLDTELHPIVSPEHWNVYSELYDMISTLPTAQSARKKGKWIKTPEFCGDDVSGFIDNHFRCSECKKEAEINSWGFYILSDFCPHCGADMRGEEEKR